MRTWPLYLLLCACSGTQIYPPGNFRAPDAGDTGDDGGSVVGLMGLGEETPDAGVVVGDGGEFVADARASETVDGGALADPSDAGRAVADAGTAQLSGTMCDVCSGDMDCAPCHVCVFRSVDGVRSCEPRSTTQAFTECPADELYVNSGTTTTELIVSGVPYYYRQVPGKRACADWRAEWKP